MRLHRDRPPWRAVRITLPDWIITIGAGVGPVFCAIVVLMIGTVVRNAAVATIVIPYDEIGEPVDDRGSEHDAGKKRRGRDDRGKYRIWSHVRPVIRLVVMMVVRAVVRIPVE
jgi:hypothetical protein